MNKVVKGILYGNKVVNGIHEKNSHDWNFECLKIVQSIKSRASSSITQSDLCDSQNLDNFNIKREILYYAELLK